MKEKIEVRRILCLLIALFLFLCFNEANGKSKKSDPFSFLPAPEELKPAILDLKEENWEFAITKFWSFLKEKEDHEKGYSLAEFSIARAAYALGLKQIAIEYYAKLVRASMDPQVLLLALQALETITHEEIYDELTIIEELVYDREFGSLPSELNDFVQYYQALMDYRNNYPRWAACHLDRITDKGEYYYRALILRARWALKEDDIDRSRQLLEEVVLASDIDKRISNEAKLALARVLYEQEDFENAYRYYREIEAQELNLADVIFEEAWAKYRQGDYKKAMGRLVAFSAPSFQHLFNPEQYILQALIYMEYCHYKAAQDTVISFLERYGHLLERIHHRKDLNKNPEGHRILFNMPRLKKANAYYSSLEEEAELLKRLQIPSELKDEFSRIYRLKMIRGERVYQRVLKREIENLKRLLFGYEEQMNLMAYESGMDRYKKVKQMYYQRAAGNDTEANKGVPLITKNTYYLFKGEFWSDELDDFAFIIDDYCKESERWNE